ncbi:hypothetical protein GCM10023149_30890 [Mucilaginibacter gynuensis]|uniref:Uncharacterized protein n=1 Tax=Mucilaginibacter gynuensis TaxID=1302236 RepID=A0ABP8GN82_9SPHI
MGEYSNVVLNGLTHDDGAENPGGVAELAYILLYNDLLAIQEPVPSTTPESILTITTAHTMKTGKSPIQAFTVMEKSDYESALEGEIYSKMFNPNLTIFLPQPSDNNAAAFSVIKNARMLVLFKRSSAGANFYQIGSKFLMAKVKEGSVKFGKGPTGEPGVTFVVESHSVQPFFKYTAVLPVTGA